MPELKIVGAEEKEEKVLTQEEMIANLDEVEAIRNEESNATKEDLEYVLTFLTRGDVKMTEEARMRVKSIMGRKATIGDVASIVSYYTSTIKSDVADALESFFENQYITSFILKELDPSGEAEAAGLKAFEDAVKKTHALQEEAKKKMEEAAKEEK